VIDAELKDFYSVGGVLHAAICKSVIPKEVLSIVGRVTYVPSPHASVTQPNRNTSQAIRPQFRYYTPVYFLLMLLYLNELRRTCKSAFDAFPDGARLRSQVVRRIIAVDARRPSGASVACFRLASLAHDAQRLASSRAWGGLPNTPFRESDDLTVQEGWSSSQPVDQYDSSQPVDQYDLTACTAERCWTQMAAVFKDGITQPAWDKMTKDALMQTLHAFFVAQNAPVQSSASPAAAQSTASRAPPQWPRLLTGGDFSPAPV
jgi:hypothetical protein